ncbi:alcohol dehydrogenase protein [Colletotrichum graminicola]|nr:alcohol dehydrogenase protein [Colletotrichum graminicola]
MSPTIPFPITTFFTKGLSFQTEAINPKKYAPILINLINSSKAYPSFIVSAVISIKAIPKYYSHFNNKKKTKVAISFIE